MLYSVRLGYSSVVVIVTDAPLSPLSGMPTPSQEGSGFASDLRLLSLEKQLNIELKVRLHFFLVNMIYFIFIPDF